MIGVEPSATAPEALERLALAALALAISGVPGLFLSPRSRWGERVAVVLALLGGVVGIAAATTLVTGGGSARVELGPTVLGLQAQLGVDALSGWFAVPVFAVGVLAAVFSMSSWPAHRRPRHGRRLRLCFGALLGSMILILLARDGVTFLIAWEVMALTNFVAVATEERRREVRRAAWLYLIYSHLTVLTLFAFFAVLHAVTGSTSLGGLPAAMASSSGGFLFVLALVAFGVKAGVMPLHSWLPAAHASAPSHVSAVMSGVVIKLGVYGLLRTLSDLDRPPLAWGLSVLALGAVAAFFGVVFALSQHDLKRLLAFHSIENIGIMLLGLGLALVGRSTGRVEWQVLGLAGCLFHVWNHALFKSLLFLGAGSVVHATGTRDLEAMGGLGRRMPVTAGLFLAGAIAICGLPPGNGFASELLVYLGLARAGVGPGAAWAALPAPVLAATGALAVACFVKVMGVVFSGTPRSAAARSAHEVPAGMLVPMAVLAAACALLGLAPWLVAPALDHATAAWMGEAAGAPRLATLVPFAWVSGAGLVLVAAIAVVWLGLRPASRRARARSPELPTWDCGYAASSARLQYTGSSFAELVTTRFAWALRPSVDAAEVTGHFPAATRFASQVDDTVLDRVLRPGARWLVRFSLRVRGVQRGNLQEYVLYVLVAILVLLMLNLKLDGLLREVCAW